MPAASRNLRGSAKSRRRRRAWLMEQFGDGKTMPCYHCGRRLTIEQIEVDRFPICGHSGGRYVKTNIVPSCKSCNGNRCTTALKCQKKTNA